MGMAVHRHRPFTAEGFGKYTTGGRVIKVTNLNDAGEGSLRHAIEQKGASIVCLMWMAPSISNRVIIENDSITIAGQSAPGEGICLKGYPFYAG